MARLTAAAAASTATKLGGFGGCEAIGRDTSSCCKAAPVACTPDSIATPSSGSTPPGRGAAWYAAGAAGCGVGTLSRLEEWLPGQGSCLRFPAGVVSKADPWSTLWRGCLCNPAHTQPTAKACCPPSGIWGSGAISVVAVITSSVHALQRGRYSWEPQGICLRGSRISVPIWDRDTPDEHNWSRGRQHHIRHLLEVLL
jgi:hypothetical protein